MARRDGDLLKPKNIAPPRAFRGGFTVKKVFELLILILRIFVTPVDQIPDEFVMEHKTRRAALDFLPMAIVCIC